MSDRRNAAVYHALSGGRSARSEPSGWQVGINAVVARAGNVSAAARELGVPRRTLRRWLAGENVPPAARRAQVEAQASKITRRVRLTPKVERKVRKARTVTITAAFRYDVAKRNAGPRVLVLNVGKGGSDGIGKSVGADVVNAFLDGVSGLDDGPGLFDVIVGAMADGWYQEHFDRDAGTEGWDVEKVIFG